MGKAAAAVFFFLAMRMRVEHVLVRTEAIHTNANKQLCFGRFTLFSGFNACDCLHTCYLCANWTSNKTILLYFGKKIARDFLPTYADLQIAPFPGIFHLLTSNQYTIGKQRRVSFNDQAVVNFK